MKDYTIPKEPKAELTEYQKQVQIASLAWAKEMETSTVRYDEKSFVAGYMAAESGENTKAGLEGSVDLLATNNNDLQEENKKLNETITALTDKIAKLESPPQ